MDARSHRVRRQTAHARDLQVTQSGGFAHQEYVAINIVERGQGLLHGRTGFLRRGPRGVNRRATWLLAPPMVIQRQVARDREQPRTRVVSGRRRLRGSGGAQKHVLRQVTRIVGVTDGATQIPEQPIPVLDEEGLDAGQSALCS